MLVLLFSMQLFLSHSLTYFIFFSIYVQKAFDLFFFFFIHFSSIIDIYYERKQERTIDETLGFKLNIREENGLLFVQ
jgi:hypothetical protein